MNGALPMVGIPVGSSLKRQAAVVSSDKLQAPSRKRQASSRKLQAPRFFYPHKVSSHKLQGS